MVNGCFSPKICKWLWNYLSLYIDLFATQIDRQYSNYVARKSDPALHQKWSFPLRISSVIVTKSAVSCRFGHIH